MRRWRLWAAFLRRLEPAPTQKGPQGRKRRPFGRRRVKTTFTLLIIMPFALPTTPPSLRAWRAELTRRIFFISLLWSILTQTTRGPYSNVAQRIWPPCTTVSRLLSLFFFVSFSFFFLCASLTENWYPDRLYISCLLFVCDYFLLLFMYQGLKEKGGMCTGVDNYLWCLICYDHRGAGGFFFVYSRMDVGFTFTLFPR